MMRNTTQTRRLRRGGREVIKRRRMMMRKGRTRRVRGQHPRATGEHQLPPCTRSLTPTSGLSASWWGQQKSYPRRS
ncbi:hypothetical protein E2C01_096560 [Portunus trituberculatus]|uniref:Uncharacterized protein n=1 Tax=Portunus trituberculatus TaxID=210409 RepID=A0A5B7K757_PORTR|nr:hypothetical protein [Portunus trituberculatus]